MSLNVKSIEEVYDLCAQTGAWHGVEVTHYAQRNFMDDTVLHTVCTWGNLAAAKVLVDAGADVNAKGDQGATPLFNAVMGKNAEVISLLLNAGANPSIANNYKRYVLEYARNVAAPKTVLDLLEKATKGRNAKKR